MPFIVSKVEKRNRKKNPAAPFTTSTLQQEAAKKLGFSSRRTMRAAQDLYEGKDVGEDGPVGLITYMRTDSPEVSDTAVASVRDFIRKSYAKPYLPESPNTYKPKKAARVQGAHEAIRPTDVRSPAGAGAAVSGAGPVPPLPADLAAVRRLADDAGGLRHDHRGLRSRPVPLPGHRLGPGVRRVPRALHRRTGEGRGQDDGRSAAHSAARRGRSGGSPGDHAVAALHRAAAPLLRGQPGQGAGAAGHRPPLHLQRHHLHPVGAGVRPGGPAALLPHRVWARRSRRS